MTCFVLTTLICALLCYLAVICEDDLHLERGGPTASAKAAAGPLCSIRPSQ